jgi:3-hydroxyacyl-[acyl-carrier-protein] dehydratase
MELDLEKTVKRLRRKSLFIPAETTETVEIDSEQVKKLLPHRPPLLFVDGISDVDLSQRTARGFRDIDPKDPVFEGHFPDYKVYPGALVLESMGQLAVCLHHLLSWGRVTVDAKDEPPPVRLLRVHHAVWLAEVLPGDRVTLQVSQLEADAYTMICGAQALKGDTIVAAAVMEVYLVEEDE